MKKLIQENKYFIITLFVIIIICTALSLIKFPLIKEKIKESSIDTEMLDDMVSRRNEIFVDYKRMGITQISPDSETETGLSTYPKLTWENVGTIDIKGDDYMIIAEYPKFTGNDAVKNLNKYISDLVNDKINSDKKEYNDFRENNPDSNTIDHKYLSLSVSYFVTNVKDGVFSLEIIMTDYTGGGNGNHDYSYPINWDLKTDKLLKNKDIFCSNDFSNILSPFVTERILKDFHSSPYITQPISKEMIDGVRNGVMKDSDNWDNFLITKNDLIVIFEPYTVASGAEGIIHAQIPFSSIKNVMCVK